MRLNLKKRIKQWTSKTVTLSFGLILGALLFGWVAQGQADDKGIIPLQGRLNGSVNGATNIVVTIKEVQSDGSKISVWTEGQTIDVKNSVFATSLGITNSLLSRNLNGDTGHVFKDASKDYVISIQVGSTTYPDIPIRRVPRAIDSALLDGKPAADYLTNASSIDATQVQVNGSTLTVYTGQTDAAISALQADLATTNTTLSNLSNSLADLSTRVTALDNPSTGAPARLDTAETKIATLEGQTNNFTTELATLSGDLSALSNRVTALENNSGSSSVGADSACFKYTGATTGVSGGSLLHWGFLEPSSHPNFQIEYVNGAPTAICFNQPGTYLVTLNLHINLNFFGAWVYLLEKNAPNNMSSSLGTIISTTTNNANQTGKHSVTRLLKVTSSFKSFKVLIAGSGVVSPDNNANIFTAVRIQ